MLRIGLALLALLCIASPAVADDTPTIVPPPGWTAKATPAGAPSGVQYVGFWAAAPNPDGTTDNINELWVPTNSASYADIIALNRKTTLAQMTQTLDVDADEPCGGASAHRFAYATTFGSRSLKIVQLFRVVGDRQYVVTYTRVAANPEDPAALASLKTICVDAATSPTIH